MPINITETEPEKRFISIEQHGIMVPWKNKVFIFGAGRNIQDALGKFLSERDNALKLKWAPQEPPKIIFHSHEPVDPAVLPLLSQLFSNEGLCLSPIPDPDGGRG